MQHMLGYMLAASLGGFLVLIGLWIAVLVFCASVSRRL